MTQSMRWITRLFAKREEEWTLLFVHFFFLLFAVFIPLSSSVAPPLAPWYGVFLRGDALFYWAIAKSGLYFSPWVTHVLARASDRNNPLANAAFFPTIPALIRLFRTVGAMVLMNVLYAASTFWLGDMLRRKQSSVWIGLALYTLSPFSVYGSLLYPQTLIVAAFLLSEKAITNKAWRPWALCGVFLATASVGYAALLGVFALSAAKHKQYGYALLYAWIIALSWLLTSAFDVFQHVPWDAFWESQKIWGRTWTVPFLPVFMNEHMPAYVAWIDRVMVLLYAFFMVRWMWMQRRVKDVLWYWTLFYVLFFSSALVRAFPILGDMRFIGDGVTYSLGFKKRYEAIFVASLIVAFFFSSIVILHGLALQ